MNETHYTSRRLLCIIISYTLIVTTLTAMPGSASQSPAVNPAKANAVNVPAQTRPDAPKREGELLVRFRSGVSEQVKNNLVASKGARRKGKARGESGLETIELGQGRNVSQAVSELSLDPSVELVEPNFLVTRDQAAPNDPRFVEQWSLNNAGQSGGFPGSDVHAPAAWRTTTGSYSTIIAVVDGGIDFSSPELKNNIWKNTAEIAGNGLDDDKDGLTDDVHGWNWVYNSNDVSDEQGHGTSVAGIIAAEGNNNAGIAGVMWRASLMSLKVLDSTGAGDVAGAVEAIDYAVAHKASVINCSWGTDAESQFLKDAIERAGRKGVIVIASAGNSGRDIEAQPYFPASFDLANLIAVASSDNFDRLAKFSNFGSSHIAVAAPGVDILTTRAGGDYGFVTGTSASAPIVTGIAGLIKTLRPGANPNVVRAALLHGSRKVNTLSGKVASGGVADAAGALASLGGNPYARAGNNASGIQGNGNGQRNGQPYVAPSLRHDNDRDRGRDNTGLTGTPVAASSGAPGPNLPNLTASSRTSTSSTASTPSGTIHADLMCADCDPWNGGGAGSYIPNDPYMGTARTRPANETGEPGVNLGSRNFNWAMPIVALPGRAGLNLNIGLYYNSLVWTNQNSVMAFNADHGTPAPGFNIGLPRLQQQFFDSDDQAYAYIMITPSGGRIEMKQTGTSGVYESADSTYTQLTFSNSTPVVRSTDGTQFIFGTQSGAEWRCTQIKDRNGNYISATYDSSNGHLLSATDTVGRVVNFNYNTDGTLDTVTQTWAGATHTYAQFIYGTITMSFDFGGLPVSGTSNNATQTVLSSIVLSGPANSTHLDSYGFDYNSYGQVYRIRHIAPDGHELARTTYTFSTGGTLSDCPRFTDKREWAQSWNGDTDGVPATAEEAVTTYTVLSNVAFTHPSSGVQMTGMFTEEALPDGTKIKEYSKETGWETGLTQVSEVWTTENGSPVKKKWSCYVWTQDNTSLSYPQNPRMAESNTYDSEGNHTRSTIEYNSGFGLPTAVREWGGANAQTLLRLTTTDYHLEQVYLNTRVIGLPYLKQVYDGQTGALISKEASHFDWDGWHLEDVNSNNVVQHDSAYNTSFAAGRGNLVLVQRFDINDPNDTGGTHVEFKYRYNITGSLIGTLDPGWSQVNYSYTDSFSDNVNRNAYAYATTVTDPEGYVSTFKYNYDLGKTSLSHKPTSGTGSGITYADVLFEYDAHGRTQQVTDLTNNINTFKRWVYDANGNYVHTYETTQDTDPQNLSTKFHSWVVLDGKGRVRARAGDHPGSTGGFSGQYIVYNNMGRLAQQSNPTEIDANWNPVGDDTLNQQQNTGGWRYTQQSYDWMGRPLITTNPDSTTRVFAYGGCGCAGGQVTTAQDEHGRKKRFSEDALGRLVKVEEMNWDGTTVYSTTNYAYNARNQMTQVSQASQTRTFEYDGHGRLWRRTTPEQGVTTYAYNADDTMASITDARGAKINYSYTGRKLVSGVSYDLSGVQSGQNVAATANIGFLYDAAGNRFWMTDGHGWASYHYDAFGRMDWEERNFTNVGTYHTSYAYNLSGQLQSMTNPWGAQVTYSYDKVGRLSGVGGANYAGVSTYASSINYRAFGSVKGTSYGDTRSLTTSYDNRLRPTKWDVSGLLGYNYNYDYFNEKTGRVTYAQSIYDSAQDRSYEYDQVGRLVIAHSGAEARAATGQGPWNIMDGPFSLGFEYDVYGNMTHRFGWGAEVQGGAAGQSSDIYYSYTNNKRSGFSYDNSGNLTFDLGQHFTYDAGGRQVGVDWTNLQQGYDGDGLRVQRTEDNTYPALYLRSSVLGRQVIAEIDNVNGTWTWWRGYVYAGLKLLAVQQGGVFFVHEDPVTKSKRVTNTSGSVQSATEFDPYGAESSFSSNSNFQPRKFSSYERDLNGTDEAMFRRYNRWHSRFDQPDPYSGSYNFFNPQSLNRYAYVGGDPVNSIDPTGLCTFNINIKDTTHMTKGQIDAVKKTLTEIFENAGQKVVFGNPRGASNKDLSFNLNINNSFPPAAVSNARANGQSLSSAVGYTAMRNGRPSNVGYVSTTNVAEASGERFAFPMAIARVGAHEAGHFFLNFAHGEGEDTGGLMTDKPAGKELADYDNTPFHFTPEQAEKLSNMCPPEQPKIGPVLGGGGGGDFGGGGGGYYGYPSWWYDMWDFVDFVWSIPVGREEPDEIEIGPF